ncbi:MAG: OsmC family protein [Rickettsiales bacterium]
MTTTIHIAYQGELRCDAVHESSGSRIHTDAPKDNNGKGENFSPTDLIATALGACMLTIMGITAKNLNVDITGATASVEKEMASSPTRRIAKLAVRLRFPLPVDEESRIKLERAALACPVHKSLHPDIETPIAFEWNDKA